MPGAKADVCIAIYALLSNQLFLFLLILLLLFMLLFFFFCFFVFFASILLENIDDNINNDQKCFHFSSHYTSLRKKYMLIFFSFKEVRFPFIEN